jgi:sarcosine oxidase
MIFRVPECSHPHHVEGHQCIVIGAGLLGLSAAWSLSRRGLDALVLESDEPGHARSGSKGNARIFRLGYPDPFYVRMALRARELWRALEVTSGQPLLHVTGQLSFGAEVGAVAHAMSEAGAPGEFLTPAQTADRFPQFAVDGPALVEETSGVLVADQCLRSLQSTGSFRVRSPAHVVALHQGPDDVTVVLGDGQELSAEVVVNCAGPRALSLMGDVTCPRAQPPSLQQVAYFGSPIGVPDIPVFIEWGGAMMYGLPVVRKGLYKVSHHTTSPSTKGDSDSYEDDPELVAMLTTAVRRILPALDPIPVATERCAYDNTSDAGFIIDRVGRVVIGSGTSGHGFKFGPLLGELLADLATGTEPSVDLRQFALAFPTEPAAPNP